MKTCKACGIDYEDNKSFCKECGAKLESKVSAKYCPDCKIEYSSDKKFCKECGSTLIDINQGAVPKAKNDEVKPKESTDVTEPEKEKAPQIKSPENQSKKGNGVIFAISVVVVIAAAVLIYIFAFSVPEEKIEAFSQTILKDNGRSIKKINSYIYTEPHTGMKFVEIKGGAYVQGDTPGNYVFGKETRTVKTFWIGMYEVTEKNWMDVLPGWSKYYDKDNYPITNQTWEDINLFITLFSKKAGRRFRLPKEAEWEYAARSGGKYYDYPNGENDITCSEACFGRANDKNECLTSSNKYKLEPVGSYAPLDHYHVYDMAGNVAELCDDDFTTDGRVKVTRGGSFLSTKKECSVFWRGSIGRSVMVTMPGDKVGFRLVLDEPNLKNEIPIKGREEIIRK